MNYKLKQKYLIKVIVITAITIALSQFLVFIPLNASFFGKNPSDITQYDIYSDLLYCSGEIPYEDNIVIVILPQNAGRSELTQALDMLYECNPKAISIDIHLNGKKEKTTDSLLIDAIKRNHNVVVPYFNDIPTDSALIKNGEYNIKKGHVALDNRNKQNAVIRTFTPYIKNNKDTIYSLAVEAVRLAYPEKIDYLKSRNTHSEYINFTRQFLSISYLEIPQMKDMIKNKIIILGVHTPSDTHITPIDQKLMGVTLHAYIASTVINQDYIKTTPQLLSKFITYIILLLFIHCTLYFQNRFTQISGFLVRLSTYTSFFSIFIFCYIIFAELKLYIDAAELLIAIAFSPWASDIYNLIIVLINKFQTKLKKLNMKHFIPFLLCTLFVISQNSIAIAAVNKSYTVNEIHGTVKLKGKANKSLKKGETINDKDILSSHKQSIVKINDQKSSYTLTFNGTFTVKELIDKIPNKYAATISNLKNRFDKSNEEKRIEYGVVTMGNEMNTYNLAENEAFVFCKEDSIGTLSVAFMRHGMEQPIMYKLSQTAYIYLLKIAVLTAMGNDYAYTSTSAYDTLWKPLEKYLKENDTIIYTIPYSLSPINMSIIKKNDEKKLEDIYNLYSTDN